MKTTVFILTLTVALAVVGCSNSGTNPVSSTDGVSSSVASKGSIGADATKGERKGVKGDRVEGTIVAVDLALGTVTIRTQAGEFVPAMTNSSTKIERNGFHATLSSFQIGDRGQARFNPGTLLAYKVEATGL
ncbi:MAG TPA: hypothetical protein VFG32_01440 [Bacteroidota bacterium]|nr:hypothetical protein [Bacteroidota bacterium]